MKISFSGTCRTLITVSATALLLASCASSPRAPEGAAAARTRLTLLQQNSELASRAPNEIRAAEIAVSAAELPNKDRAVSDHRVLIADQKIEIADAWAHSRLYEDQREALAARSDSIRLDARTREADLARSDARSARSDANFARDAANTSRTDAEEARLQAEYARDQTQVARTDANTERNAAIVARGETSTAQNQADAARSDANTARAQTQRAQQNTAAAQAANEELQMQITALNARPTDRGLVVTLGDVLFETGKAELKGGTMNDLDRLATFLNKYPERSVIIEGHTDTVGSDSSNLVLSQNRADSVHSYLVGRGIASSRLSSSGKGESSPVSDNESATGRQQNRRVEVIISNAP